MLKMIVISMRPRQWTKNVLLFAALIFSQNLTNGRMIVECLGAFGVFCLLSSGVYVGNDILDVANDREHPEKSKRPIASGRLSLRAAKVSAIIMICSAVASSFLISYYFAVAVLAYLALQIGYCYFLKKIVIMDVFSIAAGFFIRTVAGAYAISVPVSSWLLVCTFFLSLFLALAKRRHEIHLLKENSGVHRRVLEQYNSPLLDQMISVVTASTVIAYSMYTLSEETISRFHTNKLIYTIPFVLYGIYRYLYIVYFHKGGGSPEAILLRDRPMLVNIIIYVAVVAVIIYW